MNRSRHQNNKKEHTEMKCLNSTRKNRIVKANNSSLELKRDFKPINVSVDGMNKFEGKEITKRE